MLHRFVLDGASINDLQLASLRKTIDRAGHAHHTDIAMRINGQDERHEADWLKHLQEVHSTFIPPDREMADEAMSVHLWLDAREVPRRVQGWRQELSLLERVRALAGFKASYDPADDGSAAGQASSGA